MTTPIEHTQLSQLSELLHFGDITQEQAVINGQLDGTIKQPEVLLWLYNQEGIILGCSQRLSPEQRQRAREYSLPHLRRGSGGGAVLAGPWMLSVSIFIPNSHPIVKSNIVKAFSWLEQIWEKSLTEKGIDCRGVNKNDIEQSKQFAKSHGLEWACYGSLSYGEIVCPQGKKLVGLAQIRKRAGVVLVSGLNLSPFDWRPLCDVVNSHIEAAPILAQMNNYCSELTGQTVDVLLPKTIESFINNLPSEFNLIPSLGDKK